MEIALVLGWKITIIESWQVAKIENCQFVSLRSWSEVPSFLLSFMAIVCDYLYLESTLHGYFWIEVFWSALEYLMIRLIISGKYGQFLKMYNVVSVDNNWLAFIRDCVRTGAIGEQTYRFLDHHLLYPQILRLEVPSAAENFEA